MFMTKVVPPFATTLWGGPVSGMLMAIERAELLTQLPHPMIDGVSAVLGFEQAFTQRPRALEFHRCAPLEALPCARA
jgi:hypothetical protein